MALQMALWITDIESGNRQHMSCPACSGERMFALASFVRGWGA